MPTEIERKYLIKGTIPKGSDTQISQAYLCTDKLRTIRVRIEDDIATINVKTKPSDASSTTITRMEYEYEIPLTDAQEMRECAIGEPIEKTRTIIQENGHTWEVDTFHGANAGLIVAEVELESEDQPVHCPDWIGREVSSESKYFNSQLMKAPYNTW